MFRNMQRLMPLLLAAVCGFATEQAAHAQDRAATQQAGKIPLYDNLGNHHYAVTTGVPLAQRYFDQGLRLYYAFNHAEAIRSFEEAARLDPDCAMCYWGVAAAYGPNINMPMDSASGAAALAAVLEARKRLDGATVKERALVEAQAVRYGAAGQRPRAQLDSLYAAAMAQLAAEWPQDAEVLTLYAESLMDLSPWYYWERDGAPRPDTPRLIEALETALASNARHPGANHFYIHAVEAVAPDRAVPMAENLAGLMPGAGHLVHMPGHIYIRVGRYEDAIRANEHAVHADESWIQDQKPAAGIYTIGYYPHNYDFLAFAASMIGRSEQALAAADRMAALVPQELLGASGFTVLQNHATRALQYRVRFGRWDEILAAPEPAANLPYARGIWHYARGRALAARGDAAGSMQHLDALRRAATHEALVDAPVEFNAATAVLAIAGEVLAGFAAAAAGDTMQAIAHLRKAGELEDGLVYGEPPEWSVPPRQELGVLLLQAGRPAEAEQVFREDLNRFPENGWSLHGLARAVAAQGRGAEASEIMNRFNTIWSSADVRIEARLE